MKNGKLILTRRVGESLMIGHDVTVTVLASNGNQVRLGIDAPRDVEVHREEVYEQIHAALPLQQNSTSTNVDEFVNPTPDDNSPKVTVKKSRKSAVCN